MMKTGKILLIAVSIFTSTVYAQTEKSYSEKAGRADDFVATIGIGIHPPSYASVRGETNYPYSNETQLIGRIKELGIRQYRVDARDVSSDWPLFRKIYQQTGCKPNYLFSSTYWTWERVTLFLNTYGSFAESIEGPNETDCHGWAYNGQSFPEGTIAYQNTLYDLVKNHPQTKYIPVLSPSMCSPPNDQYQLYGCSCDYAVMHSYSLGRMPSWGLDNGYAYIPNAKSISRPAKPVIATEAGFCTGLNANLVWALRPNSEKSQAKYYPRMFGEYWNRGIVKTYLYELYDEGTDESDIEDSWGLLHFDNTPKPAFYTLKSMIDLLKEPNVDFEPATLDFTLAAANLNTVHHSLLAKSAGDFYLLLWQEVTSFDIDKKQDLTIATLPVTLSLSNPGMFSGATVYTCDESGALNANDVEITNGKIQLQVPDEVLYLQLKAKTAAIPPLNNQQEWKAITLGNNLIISNLQERKSIEIYNANGILLQTLQSQSGENKIPIRWNKGLYIIKIENKTQKIIVY